MSWASGSELFSEIIEILKENIDDDSIREEIYYKLIGCFENRDCDTLDECLNEDEAFDDAYNEFYNDDQNHLWDDDD